MSHSRRLRACALALTLTFALAACGGTAQTATDVGADAATDESTDAFPVTVTADNGEVTIDTRPERIVSLSSTGTEVLFAIGAGTQVVAVDEQSNHPPEAPVTDLSGFQPNLEAILSYEPDLVVASFDPGDLVAGLAAAGVTTVVQGAAPSLAAAYDQITALGAATGNAAGAATVVEDMRADIAAIAGDVSATGATYYHELDPTYYSVTSDTFIGEVYGLLGLTSIADGAEGAEYGYPQLSAEYVVAADPTFVFLADTICCEVDADVVAARPGWDQLSAVREGRVVALSDDLASRWGPRIVDYLRAVADAVGSAAT